MSVTRGQIAINTLTAIGAVIASIIAPVLYIGDIKEANAVQDVRIENIAEQHAELKQAYRELNQKIDALLIKQGIDPSKITIK